MDLKKLNDEQLKVLKGDTVIRLREFRRAIEDNEELLRMTDWEMVKRRIKNV